MLAIRDGVAKLLHRRSFKFGRNRFENHHAGIARVPDIRSRGIRNESGLVVAIKIATVGEFHVHGANDGESHAIDTYRLSNSRSSAKKFLFQPRSQKNNSSPVSDIFRGNPPALG